MNIQEFGSTIKKKYPEYADLDDAEVGRKMLAKYPQYADMVTVEEQVRGSGVSTTEKVTSGIAGVIGGKKLAQGMSAAISSVTNDPREQATQNADTLNSIFKRAYKLKVGDPERKKLLHQASELAGLSSDMAQEQIESIPTNKEVLGSAGKLALTLGTLGTSGVASGIKGAAGLAARVVEGGLTGAAYQALANLEGGKAVSSNLKTSALIGGAIPVLGAALSKGKQLLGSATKATGEKIVYSTIKPSQRDVSDGFKATTISKYDLSGSLDEMLQKTESKMADLTQQIQSKLKSTDAPVDLKEVAQQTVKKLLLENKSKNFGNSASIKRVLDSMAAEIDDVSANGLVSLSEAQAIKQAAGKKGAWVFGNTDPDASAVEKVYNAFYSELRDSIERTAPSGIREINKQISELIPVAHALIRRIPVEARNNAMSLTDLITLGTTAVNPSFAPLFIANKLAHSSKFGSLLAEFGEGVAEKRVPTTNIGKRIFGQ